MNGDESTKRKIDPVLNVAKPSCQEVIANAQAMIPTRINCHEKSVSKSKIWLIVHAHECWV
jgi:hypothetical protein